MAQRSDRAQRSPYAVPAAVGGLFAGIVFLAELFNGHPSLLYPEPTDGRFYDGQAHSLLGLHWDVPFTSVGTEGFLVHGKVYEYFGPFPALLRMPVEAFTTSLDGRLDRISMLLAFTVALAFAARIAWRVRPLVRGAAPVTSGERLAVAAFTFVVGAGSVIVFLASRSWVYHEAELWGIALAIAAFDSVIAFTLAPTGPRLALASGLATGALLSRSSVGLGPVIALGVLLLGCIAQRGRGLVGLPDHLRVQRLLAPLVAAVTIPIALYAYVNYARFGMLFSVPFDKQLSKGFYRLDQKILAANGGSWFNPGLIPTTVVTYFRPSALRLSALFPWVMYPDPTKTVAHAVVKWEGSSSYPATMPALTVLGIIGLLAVFRPSRSGRSGIAALRAPLIGGFCAAVPTLMYANLSNRYLGDVLPFGVLLAVVGLHAMLRWGSTRKGRTLARAAYGSLVVLGIASVWFNVGLGILVGRAMSPESDHSRASFVSFQYDLHDHFPGGAAPNVVTGPPPHVKLERLWVYGRCDAVLWSDGVQWHVLERSERGGLFRFRVRFPDAPTEWQPLIVNGTGPSAQYIAVRVHPGNTVEFAFPNTVFPLARVHIRPDHTYKVDVLMDAVPGSGTYGTVEMSLDGKTAWSTTLPNRIVTADVRPLADVSVGRGSVPGVDTNFSGVLERIPPTMTLCRRVMPAALDQHSR